MAKVVQKLFKLVKISLHFYMSHWHIMLWHLVEVVIVVVGVACCCNRLHRHWCIHLAHCPYTGSSLHPCR